MVVFTCGHCGDSVNKPKVEKHYLTRCRGRQPNLSCMDCFKDFFGDTYGAHTKCISEEQRYAARGFVAPAKKGETKQDAWVQLVQAVLAERPGVAPTTLAVLQEVSKHSNTPRKKAKFINFVKNVCGHRTSLADIDKAWDLIAVKLDALKATNQQQQKKPQVNNTNETSIDEKQQDMEATNGHTEETNQETNNEESSMTKKQRKEEKKRKKHEAALVAAAVPDEEDVKQKKEPQLNYTNDVSTDEIQEGVEVTNGYTEGAKDDNRMTKKQRKEEKKRKKYEAELAAAAAPLPAEKEEDVKQKKSKKNKHKEVQGEIIATDDNQEPQIGNDETRKGKKRKRQESDQVEHNGETKEKKNKVDEVVSNDSSKQEKKVQKNLEEKENKHNGHCEDSESFDWKSVIINLLKNKGGEMSHKRLHKTVLMEYESKTGKEAGERISRKLDKKLRSCAGVRLDKDKVLLAQTQ